MRTLVEAFEQSAATASDRTALRGGGRELTWAQYAAETERIAGSSNLVNFAPNGALKALRTMSWRGGSMKIIQWPSMRSSALGSCCARR